MKTMNIAVGYIAIIMIIIANMWRGIVGVEYMIRFEKIGKNDSQIFDLACVERAVRKGGAMDFWVGYLSISEKGCFRFGTKI